MLKTDLIAGILGVQVDARAPTIEWTSGQRTVLPFLSKDARKDVVQNILAQDARYVADMANLPEAGPSSSLVVYLDKALRKPELLKAAREALSHSKSVIVKNFVDTGSFNFTLEDLEEHFMISPRMPIEAHGASLFSALFFS